MSASQAHQLLGCKRPCRMSSRRPLLQRFLRQPAATLNHQLTSNEKHVLKPVGAARPSKVEHVEHPTQRLDLPTLKIFGKDFLACPPLQKMCREFLLCKFWRILPGTFLEDFSGHFFPQKREKKKADDDIGEKNPVAQK